MNNLIRRMRLPISTLLAFAVVLPSSAVECVVSLAHGAMVPGRSGS